MLAYIAPFFAVRRASATIAVAVATIATATADPVRVSYVKAVDPARGIEPRVALQPFSFDAPAPRISTATRVAYTASRNSNVVRGEWVDDDNYAAEEDTVQTVRYAPRPAPRAEPVYQEAEEENSMPEFESRSRRSGPTVPGNRAVLRNGIAYAPANAPDSVKAAIWAVNTLRDKPYKWGGGHTSLYDWGYDCSGAVSFALYFAGALQQPLPSNDLIRFGEWGRGRWITIYSRPGHTFAVIAGLRLDTTDFRGGDAGPRWHTDMRDTWGFTARHPAGL